MYEPYGKEWAKEMIRYPKESIVDLMLSPKTSNEKSELMQMHKKDLISMVQDLKNVPSESR